MPHSKHHREKQHRQVHRVWGRTHISSPKMAGTLGPFISGVFNKEYNLGQAVPLGAHTLGVHGECRAAVCPRSLTAGFETYCGAEQLKALTAAARKQEAVEVSCWAVQPSPVITACWAGAADKGGGLASIDC